MRIVTGHAIRFRIRRVLIFISFALSQGLGMAVIAQRADLFSKKALEGTRVRRMAGQAAIFALQRLVGELHLFLFILVTGKTEGIPGGNKQRLVIRGVDIVARKAASAFEWFMLYDPASHQVILLVTGETEVPPLFRCGKWVG